MNRPLSRRANPSTVDRTQTAAPAMRLDPFAAAIRAAAWACACTVIPAFAQNLPDPTGSDFTGNDFVLRGDASVTSNGTLMSITQTGEFTHLSWDSFNIGSGRAVEVDQQVGDFLLNEVVTNNNPTEILGRLSGPGNTASAGQIAVINPAGILVGASGIINVGGLIAISLDVDAIDTGNGNNQPDVITLDSGNSGSGVEIESGATITAGQGGVLLAGRTVTNAATITSAGPIQIFGADGMEVSSLPDGAQRNAPTVDLASLVAAPGLLPLVNNTGSLIADATATNGSGGNVLLVSRGAGGVITGTVSTTGDGTGDGGSVTVDAEGDVTVGAIDASGGDTGTAGDITIGSSDGAILDDDADDDDAGTATRIVGNVITLDSATGVGTAAGDIDTAANSLVAGADTSGVVNIQELDGVTLTDVDATAGDVTVSAGGPVTVTAVSGTGVTLVTDALDISDISGAIDAGTGVVTLRPLTDGTAISLGTPSGGEWNLTSDELDDITAGRIVVGSSVSGSLTVNTSIAPANAGALSLISGGSVTTAAGATVTETTLLASAGTGIDLDTDVSTLDASVTGTGAIVIDEANGLTLRDVETSDGDITVTSTSGSITAGRVDATGNTVNLSAAAGSIADDGDGSGLTAITADTVNLTVVDGGAIGANTGSGSVPANYLDLTGTPTIAVTGNAASAHIHLVTTGTVTSTQTGGLIASGRDIGIAVSNGNFTFNDASFAGLGDGNLEVVANAVALNVDTSMQQEVSTTGNVLLRARTGAITDLSDANAALDITANELTLDAVTGIAADTTVADLDASIAGAGAGGTLSITETDGVILSDVDHANGNISITAAGPITATAVEATGGTVNLTATGMGNGITTTLVSGTAVTLGAAGAVSGTGVAATDLEVTGTSIDLGTTVQNLNASASSGTLKITEANGITLTDVDNSNGSIEVTATGAITATDVVATGGNVNLTANGASNGISTTVVSGSAVTLTAAGAVTGTGVSATDLEVTGASIDLGTTVQNLNASASSGTLKITETNGITLTDVDNSNGSIDVTAAGTIAATDVVATGGDVTLTATGASNGISTTVVSGATVSLTAPGTITGTGVTATNLALNGGSISLGTSVGTLTATATSGDLVITESNGIVLSNVATSNNGNISVTANDGNIVAGTVNAGTGNVTLDADQVGGQQIRDDASGSLDTTTRITGNAITLLATAGIGAGNENVDINGNSLVAQTTTGALNINEANSVTLTTFTNNAGGDVALSTGSAQTLNTINVGSNTLRYETRDPGANLTVGGTLQGGTVILSSGGAIVDGNAVGPDVQANALSATASSGIDLDTAVGSISASGGAGAISIEQATGALTLTSLSNTTGGITVNAAGGPLTVTSVNAGSGGAVQLASTGSITGTAGTNVTGQSLNASAGTGGIVLDTAVSSLTATAGGTGNIDIDNSTLVTLDNVTTNDGNIRVDAAAGNITVGTVTAGSGGNVTLTADGGGQSIRDDGNDGDSPTRVTGNLVTLNAGTDIGSVSEDLDTDATTIVATASGVINIDELNGATLNASNPNGSLSVTAGGPLVVNSTVANLSADVSGPGALDITETDGVTFGTIRTNDGAVSLSTGGDTSVGLVRGDGVSMQVGGDLTIRNVGQIDGRDGVVTIAAVGDVAQEPGRGTDPAVRGDSINIVAGGNVGLLTLPLSVDGGVVAIDFSNNSAVAFITGVFSSLNESARVLGLGSNTVLANNVGAIQSSFEERVSFKLDSSQFATETRIFSVEGTGILPPEDQRE